MSSALITGITGQDGCYLAQLLLAKGYRVHGTVRRLGRSSPVRLEEAGIAADVTLHEVDLADLDSIRGVVERAAPREIYNLAAQSSVASSFKLPFLTTEVDAFAVTGVLEAVRLAGAGIRFYQASSSEMFGKVSEVPQTEATPFRPRSPYGVAKLYAHWMTVNYREAHRVHAVSGILFNHESPLRGQPYVTRKITLTLARIKHGEASVLELGNLDAKRDWGFAGDYAEGMWRMLQRDEPEDFLLATGRTASVREFVELAAAALGFRLRWQGSAREEVAVDAATARTIVRINPEFYRPAEIDVVLGSAAKAERLLGWKARTELGALATMMAEADDRRVRDKAVTF